MIKWGRPGRRSPARATKPRSTLPRSLDDRRSEGQFLTYLGCLHARQGRFADAERPLYAGEALLRSLTDRISLGILHCSKAEAQHLGGHAAAALATLQETELLARSAASQPESGFGLSLNRTRALFGH